MKALIILYSLTILFSEIALAEDYSPMSPELINQICIERLEDPGILNIRETRVVIDDKQELTLVGGQAACVFVSSGDHYIYAESYDPYDPSSKNPKAWSSNRVQISTKKRDRVEFELKQGKESMSNQWKIEEVLRGKKIIEKGDTH